jgi:hypothetical protein
MRAAEGAVAIACRSLSAADALATNEEEKSDEAIRALSVEGLIRVFIAMSFLVT